MSPEPLLFPDHFIWGVATAGHQIEGNNRYSNWWAWEQQGLVRDGTTSGRSMDYWNRYEEDHVLMKQLGIKAFRLGIEWARVEPQPGCYDAEVIAHYKRILDSLHRHGIRICLTLNHWVLPQWVAEQHDWLNPKTTKVFLQFCNRVIDEMGSYPDWWVTLNEPMMPAIAGNLLEEHPPQRHSWRAYRAVSRALLNAHAQLYTLIHRKIPAAPDGTPTKVGIAQAYPLFEPWHSGGLRGLYEQFCTVMARCCAYDAWDSAICTGRHHLLHGLFKSIPLLKNSYDYCGINYYFRMSLQFDRSRKELWHINENGIPEHTEHSQMGWQIYPAGLHTIIQRVWKRFHKPILITENGIADSSDQQRPAYILAHLYWLHRAIQAGIPVEGYFYWSFIDNFEWREGYAKKFGLVHADPSDEYLTRTPRKSALLYAAIIRNHGITPDIVQQYAPELHPFIFPTS